MSGQQGRLNSRAYPDAMVDSKKGGAVSNLWRRYWLTLLVHLDAFRLDPPGYGKALLWRLRGLRVRSRNRLASLMGRSPHVYSLWISRAEPDVRKALLGVSAPGSPSILPIVDCTGSSASTEVTLRSIRNMGVSSEPIIVGGECAGAALRLDTAAELAGLVSPKGTWLSIVKPGDQFAPDALGIYAKAAAQSPEAWVIYADDDLIDEGLRREPHFKPGWNPELFEHHDFISGSAIVRATPEMLKRLDNEEWQATLTKAAVIKGTPVHLAAVLHHRRDRPQPSLPRKSRGIPGPGAPLVSIIVPTRNRLSLLRTCIEGVKRTAYPKLELLVVNNDSDDPDILNYFELLKEQGIKVLEVGGPFNFSALNNVAAKEARGELLCFLNNDVEIIEDDWLAVMVPQAIRSEIGAVGGRLLYPDGTVQHAGVVTGVGGGAGHAHRFQRDDESGYFLRDRLPQRVSAVTAACLVVSKKKFEAVGGFDEQNFPVAFNDVDLCMKLNSRGWQSFYEPRAVLIHHESKSRGSDSAKENRERFAEELAALKRHWGTDQIRDPYHHPHLSPFCEQFRIAV
jgi:GT2 family glycosyltransferase